MVIQKEPVRALIRSPRHEWKVAILVMGLAIGLVFGRTVTFAFTNWDDNSLIYNNPLVNPPTMHNMVQCWKESNQGLFIPVTYNLWSVLSAIGRWSAIGRSGDTNGAPAWPYHLANVFVHFVNAIWVLIILRRHARFPMQAAVLGSAVFALHPLQVEVVAWATGMKDGLSSCFALAAIAAHLEAASAWKSGRNARGHALYSLSLACFFIGSLAKPGIVGAPLIAAILDVAFIGAPAKALQHIIAPVLVILPSAYLTSLAQSANYGWAIWLIQRPPIALHALGFYLWKLFVPSQLCLDYGYQPAVVLTEARNRWLMLLPALFMVCLLVARRWRRELLIVGAIFLAGVVPVLGLTPFYFQCYSTVADRYIYLSMLGPAIAIAYVFTGTQRPIFQAALLMGIVGLAAMTFVQAGYWRSSFDIMAHTTRVNPRAFAAYNNMASAVIPLINTAPEFGKSGASTQPVFAANDPLVPPTRDLLLYQFAVNPRPGPPIQNLIWLQAKAGHYADALGLAKTGLRIAAIYDSNPDISVIDQFGMACLYQLNGDRVDAARWLCYGLVKAPGDPKFVRAIESMVNEQKSAATQSATKPAQ